jgi:ribosomal-protein-alanine N-acetyltransferase
VTVRGVPVPIVTRLLTLEDAPALAGLLQRNQAFLAPWEPIRPANWCTPEGQRQALHDVLALHAQGLALPHAVLDHDGAVAGRITLTGIARGAFLSASLGYWVSQDRNGRGLATAAVGRMKSIAFGELGLHRIEAGTLEHNAASQRVLRRNGFVRFGFAPRYVRIAGRWQDHVLFQVLDEDEPVDVTDTAQPSLT